MAHNLFEELMQEGYNFFVGVPDSALKDFQNEIQTSPFENVIATNEGQAVAIAFGAELAGKKAFSFWSIFELSFPAAATTRIPFFSASLSISLSSLEGTGPPLE